jgi:poly-gamma-glutamate synthesis protein (capsule biosynthesis protein)
MLICRLLLRIQALVRIRSIGIALLLVALAGVGAEPARCSQGTVTLAAVGDVFFCRGVAQQMERHGLDYPFEFVADILSRYDLGFCNLECTFSTRGTAQNKRFLFRADPSTAHLLSTAGFEVISLANNHTLDFGPLALLDTVQAVEDAGMMPVGTHLSGSDDPSITVVERNGLRIGFLALSDFNVAYDEAPEGYPVDQYPVINHVDIDRLPQQVADAKGMCDTLVVSVHWGIDYISLWTERQRLIAQTCIDNGADLVLGHHPHVLQDVVTYEGKTIVYSIGAFVWDSTLAEADKSAIFVFELSRGGAVLVETIPVRIVDCRPIP